MSTNRPSVLLAVLLVFPAGVALAQASVAGTESRGGAGDAVTYRENLRVLEDELRLLGKISELDPGSAERVEQRTARVLSGLRSLEDQIRGLEPRVAYELLSVAYAVRLAAETGNLEHLAGRGDETGKGVKGAPAPGSLSGTVTDAVSGKPIANVLISVFTVPFGGVAANIRTDAAGKYLAAVAPGTYSVKTTNDSGYVDELYDNVECAFLLFRGCQPRTGAPIDVLPGTAVGGIDFQLDRGGTIRGTVLDSLTAEPVSGGSVVVLAVEGLKQKRGEVDSSGSYAVSGLPPGDYFVRMDVSAYQNELYDGVACSGLVGEAQCDTSSARPVTVTADETVSGIDFTLERLGVISGVVVSEADGEPIFVSVYVRGFTGGLWSQTTDASGSYTFGSLAPGTYFVATDSFVRYLDEVHDNVPCPADPGVLSCDRDLWTPVVVELGSTVRIDFELAPLSTIAGTVRDAETGQPLPGVDVVIWGETRSGAVVTTDEAGRFRPVGLYPDTYFLDTFNRIGYLDEVYQNLPCDHRIPGGCQVQNGTPVELALETDTTGIDFDLVLGGSIAGKLTDAEAGAPIASASVAAFDRTGRFLDIKIADSGGHYLLPQLATGQYFVRTFAAPFADELFDNISCAGGCDVTTGVPVPVTAGATTAGIDFALRRLGAITGRVTDQDTGVPLEGFPVVVFDANGQFVNGGFSDEEGWYRVEGLVSGTYTAVIESSEHYTGEIYDNVLCTETSANCDPDRGTPIEVEEAVTVTGIDFTLEKWVCEPFGLNLCLNNGRFRVDVTWENQFGETGLGRGVELTRDTGYFTFFGFNNVEVVVKVLDGCFPPFNTFWVFAAGLTNLETEITVTDTTTDLARRYRNTLGTAFEPVFDTAAFATCDAAVLSVGTDPLAAPMRLLASPSEVSVSEEPKQGTCVAGDNALCFNGDRFRAEAFWKTPDGKTGQGRAVPLTRDTGFFWFFSPDNVEVVVKVLDACNLFPFFNYWTFAAGLTTVEVRLRVTDTVTGDVQEYTNPQGRPFRPILDTSAFSGCP